MRAMDALESIVYNPEPDYGYQGYSFNTLKLPRKVTIRFHKNDKLECYDLIRNIREMTEPEELVGYHHIDRFKGIDDRSGD